MGSKLLNLFFIIATLLMLSVFILFAYFVIRNSNAFTANEPLPILNGHEFKAGEVIKTQVSYCSATNEPITIRRGISNSEIIPLDTTAVPVSFSQGCRDIEINYKIPTTLKPGTYGATLYITIPTLNFGRIFQTVPFEIVE